MVSLGNIEFSLEDEEFGRIFQSLKSACQSVILDPSQNNLDTLSKTSHSINPKILGKFLRYILVPLGIHLSKGDKLSCDILKCLSKILQKCEVSDIDIFLNIYTLSLRKLQDSCSPETVRNTSEELKLEVVKCVSQLIKCSSSEVRQTFLSRDNYSKLSVGVFLCSQLAAYEKFLSLRLEALNCLLLMTHLSDDQPADESFKLQLADVLMLMVPGLSGKCISIINNNETQNHKPIVLALRLWSRLVAVVMADSTSEKLPLSFSLQNLKLDESVSGMESLRHSRSEDFLTALNGVKRDGAWIRNTDRNMSSVSKIIVGCQTHQHWRVRHELAAASFHILETSATNMPQSAGYFAEALTFLSQDDNSTVNNLSRSCIAKLAHKCGTQRNRKLVDIVEENFYSLLTRFPRILRGADITRKEKELILLCGFMDILGHKHLPAVLSSAQHLNRFLHCIILCATPDCSSVTLMEEAALRGIDSTFYSTDPKWRNLKLCDSPKFESTLKILCRKLIKYSDIEMLINSLLDEFNSNSSQRRNICLLLIYLFSSGSSGDFQEYSSLLRDVMTTIMENSLWKVPLVANEETPRNVVQENILQVCLLCELVGCLSAAAGRETFSPLLLDCLYPLLEAAGSPLRILSSAGQLSLVKLASLSEGGEVSSLIQENVDYLSHHVMLKLRQAHRNPGVLSVLSIIMDYTSLNMISSLHDIINDVLIQSCDMFQDINGSAFLHVFHSYLSCMKKWMVKPPPPRPPKREPDFEKEMDLILAELIEYDQALIAADTPTDETGTDTIDLSDLPLGEGRDGDGEEKEEVKAVIPDHVKLTKDILSRSLHFLPADNITRQILVLEILNQGIEILSPWTAELLPIVHKIWCPLVVRFRGSSHPLLLQRAFSLLLTLGRHSKDFIRVRTAKEVLPSLYKVLKESSKESKKNSDSAGFRLTQLYKLQLLLLSSFGDLARDLDLNYKQAYTLLLATTPYLSAKQPQLLQDACVMLYKDIADAYADIVWAHLMCVCPTQLELKAPLQGLQDYQVELGDYSKEEYIANVDKIMGVI